jgi:hypothetical protein
MAKKTDPREVKAPRGEKMRPGKAWRLITPGGRAFKATLVKRLNIGSESVAVFRVLRKKD